MLFRSAAVPPPTATNDSDIHRTLDHVLTIQAAQGQILVDMLDEILVDVLDDG